MTINELLSERYNELFSKCNKNVYKQVENSVGIKDNEETDLLNTLCLRWLKKYKDIEIQDPEKLFEKLKTEFLTEKNYFMKMAKPNRKIFVSIENIQTCR